MKIVVTGYTYTRTNLFEVFDSYPERENLYFILPNNWKAKEGKVIFKPFRKEGFNIYNSPAFFFNSHYPLLGGLLKGWMPFFVFRLLWLRLFGGVNILYTAGEPNLLSTLYNAFWAKIFGMKHVFLFWENIPYETKDRGAKLFFKKVIIKMNIALSDGAICGIQKAKDILLSFKPGFPVEAFLHAGFNTDRFKPGLEPRFRTPNLRDNFIFLFVGALSYRKGIHLILEALDDLKEKYHNLYFLIIGSGEYEESLKLKVKSLKLENVVQFLPWMANEDLPYVFNSADVFLYPSIPYRGWEEQFGYSIAEASLCELPVISTHSGSIFEVLIDGKTGIMIKPDSKEELNKAMEKLILDNDLRIRLGKYGRDYIKNNFSNEVIAKKLYNLFKRVYSK